MDIVINLDKPKGITSHQAVQRVRKIVKIKKAGHAGTLDPAATGVLLVCTGEATKITRFLSDLDKEYVAVVKLGEKTDTYDSDGNVTEKTEDFSLDRKDIEQVLPIFTGVIEQTPPMYSAIKMSGKPLYTLARKGVTVERPKRTVVIREIKLTGFDLPFFELRVSCSKGTYIRSLCNDIGETLGVGAHITDLRRTQIGDFRVEDSLTPDQLEYFFAGPEPATGCRPGMSDIDNALRHLRELALTGSDFKRASDGLPLRFHGDSFSSDECLRLKDPSGKLFAIGKSVKGIIRVERILHLR